MLVHYCAEISALNRTLCILMKLIESDELY